jgi:Mg-chelatase subunit ChlD
MLGDQGIGSDGDEADLLNAGLSNAWDVATRYHDFKTRPSLQKVSEHLREISTEAILEKARAVLGAIVHPSVLVSAPWDQAPAGAEALEIDLDETLQTQPQELWMEYRVRRSQPVVLSVDTSLSMTGEKLALTAVALAVVALQFPEDPIGIIAFENRAVVLKRPEERLSPQALVSRFLDVPAQGYTHLEAGIQQALRQVDELGRRGRARVPATVLLTDGKYTAGRDPAYLAPRFRQLHVLKMGEERASLPLCRELARRGHGTLREVPELEALPGVMYGVVKDLLRGRA